MCSMAQELASVRSVNFINGIINLLQFCLCVKN